MIVGWIKEIVIKHNDLEFVWRQKKDGTENINHIIVYGRRNGNTIYLFPAIHTIFIGSENLDHWCHDELFTLLQRASLISSKKNNEQFESLAQMLKLHPKIEYVAVPIESANISVGALLDTA